MNRTESDVCQHHAQIARQVLAVCGPGKLLGLGCGVGALVQELVKQGIDAYGVDTSFIATAFSNRRMPGRFTTASVLSLPFEDESFDSLVSDDCLEYLAPNDVLPALREMRRICSRNLLLRISTHSGLDGRSHLTKEKRAWWETRAFEAGFRKHPQYYELMPFHALENESNDITLLLEKIAVNVLNEYPLSKLLETRELHMDMSRETGRRSDGHMARYQLASTYVRDGDRILDAACGLGYGTKILAWQTGAVQVIGVDLDEVGLEYAQKNFSTSDGRISFKLADATNLSSFPDNSLDVVVSFETLEHVPDPQKLIAEAKRVLRPTGRLIVSVPNQWINEQGIDPNPFHLHVYDWNRLQKEMSEHFILEAGYGQTAGGGMKLTAAARSLFEFPPMEDPPKEAEWWLAVGMKEFKESQNIPYQETALRWSGEPPNVVAFQRDFENPWIVRGLVSIGWRIRNASLVEKQAKCILGNNKAKYSVDHAAALCVLAYRLLESTSVERQQSVIQIGEQIDKLIANLEKSPQGIRWTASLLYVQGLMYQSIGNLESAHSIFKICANVDILSYSPLLATKTVDACWRAGVISFQSKKFDEAKELWQLGVQIAEKSMKGNWREVRGDIDHPFTFGLREACQILDTAGRCVDALHHLEFHMVERGLPDEGSLMIRLEALENKIEQNLSSPYARLERVVQGSFWSVRRNIRLVYLLGVILTPKLIKRTLRPIVKVLRGKFE